VLSLPVEEQKDDQGRAFSPADKYYRMTAKQKEKHWTFGASELNALRAAETVVAVNKSVEEAEKQFEATAKQRGWARSNGEGNDADAAAVAALRQRANGNPREQDFGVGDKPRPVGGGNDTRISPQAANNDKGPKSAAEVFKNKLVGR
jgi:hypothetical protein